MKKILFLLFTLSLFISCGTEKEELPPDKVTVDDGSQNAEKIFKETGCKPTEAGEIVTFSLFTDINNTKYLYGSKKKNEVNIFWVAQFNSAGDQVWEIQNKDKTYNSRALNPVQISNGKIIFANVTETSNNTIDGTKGASPVMIDKDGKAKFINVFEGYYYSNIYEYDDFFFCILSQNEFNKLPDGTKMYNIQLDYEGNILNQAEKINIPHGFALWKNKDYFITMYDENNKSIIEKQHVVAENTDKNWTFEAELPGHKSYEANAYFVNDSVVIDYDLVLTDETKAAKSFKLSYETGKLDPKDDPDSPENYVYLELGKEYLAPSGLSVTLETIQVVDDGAGETDYFISYTVANKNEKEIIPEGIFEMYFGDYTKGPFQTGAFDKLHPGEYRKRAYVFTTSSSKPYFFIQYKHDLMESDKLILRNSLKWKTFPDK